MFYNGWEVTQLRGGAWKATRNGNALNATNPKLLKAMINEQEGLPIKEKGIVNTHLDDRAIKLPSVKKQLEVYKSVLRKK